MIICQILVTFYVGKIAFMQREQVEGKLISSGIYKHLVDFSEDAKKKEFVGDYSRVLVNKQDCL